MDLIRFEGRWFCTFREGGKHVSDDGAVATLTVMDEGQGLRSVVDLDTEL